MRYPTAEGIDLAQLAHTIGEDWDAKKTFQQSLNRRQGAPPMHFYEGPPGTNGDPGLHHWFCRVYKDLLCRYKTMQGYRVERQGGWDTHGLPVALAVQKQCQLTKEAIGKSSKSVADFNQACRKTVTHYRKRWEVMTKALGYWIDLEHPYTTCDSAYVSQLWGVLKALYAKGYLYKGYSIQPYSPMAGTGLSTHELNQPGCYREVADLSVVAQFKLKEHPNTYLLAWTTTPWTLPANSALAIHPEVTYITVETVNRYTGTPIKVILAEEALARYFDPAHEGKPLQATAHESLPWVRGDTMPGTALIGATYEQLLPYVQPRRPAFFLVRADFVTTTEGTGIVHIAPHFGTDDHQLAQKHDIPAITVTNDKGEETPIVDRKGRFVAAIHDFQGAYVKAAYDPPKGDKVRHIDAEIARKLQRENKAFHVATHRHQYPHCWRTDCPILYYPLHAWFIKTTACKERLIALNRTIRWHPPETGAGRFGEWLHHVRDWNITRDRFWGTPLPIWRTADGQEERCIGSVQELRTAVQEAVAAGQMQKPLPEAFDPHRPHVDSIVLVSQQGKPMYREQEVIDGWFDSGAMPYARDAQGKGAARPTDFPADFIVEGVDQTRGWFFTLHVLAVLLHDRVAFKEVLATGLVLDTTGRKMSKRLGNVIDPKALMAQHGPDAIRWYMVAHTDPWENIKFDPKGLEEVRRKFFGTLLSTYQFFALYAELDGFHSVGRRPELKQATQSDRWIIDRVAQLVQETTTAYEVFTPTQAARAIQRFVVEDLSNWYVRLNRERFWQQGAMTPGKQIAYETLSYCLLMVTRLAAPIAPFVMDWLYRALMGKQESLHLTDFPQPAKEGIDRTLDWAMRHAQRVSSLVHRLRKQQGIKVRQPLQRILLLDTEAPEQKKAIEATLPLLLKEVNVKALEWIQHTSSVVRHRVRPNFRALGKRYGPQLKAIGAALQQLSQEAIEQIEREESYHLKLSDQSVRLSREDLLITPEDMPGWAVARDAKVFVALDLHLTPDLLAAGRARELVRQLQHLRKEKLFAVADWVHLRCFTPSALLRDVCKAHHDNIVVAVQIRLLQWLPAATPDMTPLEVDGETLHVGIKRA